MGFDRNSIKLILNSLNKKLDKKNILTLGRQVMYIEREELISLLKEYTVDLPNDADFLFEYKDYCESFFKILGAKGVDSIDASDYESATFIHDMNKPIAANGLDGKYDVVVDSGTLEHIFNFPVAIENCMRMVKCGGCYLSFTPANNLFGHGFYQFSPELLYRIFSAENGFEVERMILYEAGGVARFFEMRDPAKIKNRITMVNSKRVYLFIIAKKIAEVPIFSKSPQQSDYENVRWQGETWQANTSRRKPIIGIVKKLLPTGILKSIYLMHAKKQIANRVIGNMADNNFIEVEI